MGISESSAKLSSSFVRAIEEAVLVGSPKEIDGILDQISEEASFPDEMRYALEALRYFQQHYRESGLGENVAKKNKYQIMNLETLWCDEIMKMAAGYSETGQKKCA